MSKALIEAAASYFGMDPARLNMDTSTMTVGAKMALRFTLSFDAADDDYIGICKRMAEMRKFNMEEKLDAFLGEPRKEGAAAPSNWSKQPEPTMGMVYAAVTRIEKSIQDAIDAAQPSTEEEQPAPEQGQDEPAYVPMPSLEQVIADPVAYMDRPECSELLYRAQRASKAVREKLDVERDRLAAVAGMAGQVSPTVRVDKAPAEPDQHPRDTGDDEPANRLQAKMDDAVWLWEKDVTPHQRFMALDMHDLGLGMRYQIPASILTPDQLLKSMKA